MLGWNAVRSREHCSSSSSVGPVGRASLSLSLSALQAEQAARRKAEELLKQSVESGEKLRAQLKGEVSKRR